MRTLADPSTALKAPAPSRLLAFANPARFMRLASLLLPWLGGVAALLLAIGLYLAWFAAPADYQQGETVRIMFLHVPAAWLALFFYTVMTVSALGTLVWRHPLADVSQKAAAPIGAAFTLICLVTGSLWGKPMWGTYWVWDARLTSVLILFLMYCGTLALWQAIEEPAPRRPLRRHPDAGRGDQRADREILGRLVEYAASTSLGAARRRAGDPSLDALSAPDHGARLHPARDGAASCGDARGDPPPARAHAVDPGGRAPRRPRGVRRWSSGRTPPTSSAPTR